MDEEAPCLRANGDAASDSSDSREVKTSKAMTWQRVSCMFCGLIFAVVACIYWYFASIKSLDTKTAGKMTPIDQARGRTVVKVPGTFQRTDTFTSGLDSARPYCNSSLPILHDVSPRAFKLAGEWNETCFEMEHPNASEWAGRNWCWAWMKHAGCYAHRGDITWLAAQELTANMMVVPHHTVQALEPLLDPELCDIEANGISENYTEEEEAEAMRWIEKTITFYVLNMDKNDDRLAQFASRMSTLGLKWDRIPGVNVSAHGGMEKAVLEGLVPPKFNYTVAAEYATRNFQGMHGITGDVGTAAAHFRVMKHIITETTTPIAVVFEDDAYAHDGFAVRLYRMLVGEAPCDWEAITLRSRCAFGQCVSKHLSRVTPDGNEPQSRCRHGVNYGFYGMVYRKNAVHHIVEQLMPIVWNEKHPHCLDIDVALASISDTVAFYAVPSSQMPGLLQEKPMGSNRRDVNKIGLGELMTESPL